MFSWGIQLNEIDSKQLKKWYNVHHNIIQFQGYTICVNRTDYLLRVWFSLKVVDPAPWPCPPPHKVPIPLWLTVYEIWEACWELELRTMLFQSPSKHASCESLCQAASDLIVVVSRHNCLKISILLVKWVSISFPPNHSVAAQTFLNNTSSTPLIFTLNTTLLRAV